MKYFWISLILVAWICNSQAQTIAGNVTDENGNFLPGSNIYLKGRFDGTISDSVGNFRFASSFRGDAILVASLLGYSPYEIPIRLQSDSLTKVKVKLHVLAVEVNEVTVTAGVFEAGDKKRGVQLSAMDALTTPNSNGDIYQALNTLPGAQSVGEEGGLFVRGGEQGETKTYVDGMLVSFPYTAKIPDVPSRGRFSPMLFSGVSFSSGGYSAEYGQALSAALILQTKTFPDKSITSISLYPFGAGISRTWKQDSSAFILDADYHNMSLYNHLIPQEFTWTRNPQGVNTTMMYRKKINHKGLLKVFLGARNDNMGLILPAYLSDNAMRHTIFPDADSGNTHLNLVNNDIYVNAVYTSRMSCGWLLMSGASYNYDEELVSFDKFSANTYNQTGQVRFTISKWVKEWFQIKSGVELNEQHYLQNYTRKDSIYQFKMHFDDPIAAIYLETSWNINSKLFFRLGGRLEYTALQNYWSIVPRAAMAYKTSENGQISMAYGIFNEQPLDDYLKFNASLSPERAVHYILNYQYEKDNRLFRTELFYKGYSHLVTYDSLNNDPNPVHYQNNGYGYARGIELFLRDKKTIDQGEFWISYSLLDTKKKYQDITNLTRPYLFSKNSLSVVGKYYVPLIRSQVGMTYQYYSGRPYFIPISGGYSQATTPNVNDISLNISYLTHILDNFTVIHFSVSNVLGSNQTFGYNYVSYAGNENRYSQYAVTPQAKRFFVLGIFITFNKYWSGFN